MAKLKGELQADNGDILYPHTSSDVVFMNDGRTVEEAVKAVNVSWSGISGKPSTFPPSTHTHTKSQITDFPTSLPANGGNADTVDGKHASDFLPKVGSLSQAVSDINNPSQYQYLFYDVGGGNFAGMGVDGGGGIRFRTGTNTGNAVDYKFYNGDIYINGVGVKQTIGAISVVKSIQRGIVTSNMNEEIAVSISPVNLNKAMVLLHGWDEGGSSRRATPHVKSLTTNQLVIGGTTYGGTISWQVVEYN